MHQTDRRQFLAAAGGVGFALAVRPAEATPASMKQAMRQVVGEASVKRGKIKLDNATLDQWSPDALGKHIGYLPQDVELFEGSIAVNIARFDANATSDAVLEEARAAGAHDLILSLPDGYSTQIGEGGMALSFGQRQRIGLARALYGNPFMVVLDEPTASVDSAGEEALTEAILGVRRRGGIGFRPPCARAG